MAIVTACATSNHSIGEAWRMIKFGDADAFLCGGAEATILPMGLSGFSNMRALSTTERRARTCLASLRQGAGMDS